LSSGTPEIFIGMVHTKFDNRLEPKDETTRQFVARQLGGFGEFIERVRS
jgi:hypothetical protein